MCRNKNYKNSGIKTGTFSNGIHCVFYTRPKIKSFKNSNNLCVSKLKMGFLESFNKKEDINKKESSSSNLDEMPPPPLPSKEQTDKKKEDKDKSNLVEKSDPIPPPPQMKKQVASEPILPKEPVKTEESLIQASPDKQTPTEQPPKKEEERSKPITAPETSPEPKLTPTPEQLTPFTEKSMPNQFSPQIQGITQPELQKTPQQAQQSVTVPETLPKMPSLSIEPETKEQSSYTFTQEIPTTEEIPYFSNVKVKESKDEFEELFNLPIIDMEEDAESYGRFKYRDLKKPLFIRTDNYSQILTNIDTMKTYVEESSDKISMLNNLKRNADIEHKKYKQVLEDVQRKLIYIDRVLFDS